MSELTRRRFIAASAVLAAGSAARAAWQPAADKPARAALGESDAHRGGPVVIGSLNGLRACDRAMALLREGFDPADAIVQGVRIIEDDPADDSVGLGGLPNAEGVVELDASVMHGPTHKSGAVAGIRNIKNPAQVALLVLRRTDHCLLVGEGAYRFARAYGFQHEELLTEHARQEWLHWKNNMSHDDDYLNDDERDAPVGRTWDRLPWQDADAPDATPRTNDGPDFRAKPAEPPKKSTRARPYIMDVTGTVHCSALTGQGDIASCTSTSGLNWKIPGRVGDSPIIGAGNYCDNDIGAAGSTGRGEANIVTLAAARIVDFMAGGLTPTEACLKMCRYVVDHTKEKRLRTGDPDRPLDFDLKFYALRKDGAFGAASLYSGGEFSAHDGTSARRFPMAYLYERKKKD